MRGPPRTPLSAGAAVLLMVTLPLSAAPVPEPQAPAAAGAKSAAKAPPEKPAGERRRAPVDRSAVLKAWVMPSKPLEKEIDPYGQVRIHDLFLCPEGDLLVTQSERDIFTLDMRTGKLLQTFRPEGRNMLVSPDGRTVAEFVKGGKELTFRSTRTGAPTGTFRPGKDESFVNWVFEPAFTPDGRELVIALNRGSQYSFVAIAAGSGTRRPIPHAPLRNVAQHAVNIPLPDRGVFLRHLSNVPKDAARVSALHLATGKESPLTAIDIDPASLFHFKGIKLSPDGRYLVARSNGQAQVVEWETNRRLLTVVGGSNLNAVWFTPDSRRLLAVRNSRYEKVNLSTGVQSQFPNWIELYDIASRTRVVECVPEEYGMGSAHALTFSEDGRRLVMSYQTTVKVFDFQKLFGLTPRKP